MVIVPRKLCSLADSKNHRRSKPNWMLASSPTKKWTWRSGTLKGMISCPGRRERMTTITIHMQMALALRQLHNMLPKHLYCILFECGFVFIQGTLDPRSSCDLQINVFSVVSMIFISRGKLMGLRVPSLEHPSIHIHCSYKSFWRLKTFVAGRLLIQVCHTAFFNRFQCATGRQTRGQSVHSIRSDALSFCLGQTRTPPAASQMKKGIVGVDSFRIIIQQAFIFGLLF